MLSLYVSASKVDEYRKVVQATEDEFWLTEEKLVKQIREPEALGWQALYGEALHALIAERGKTCEWTSRDGKTVTWPAAVVRQAADSWPVGCLFERRAVRDYHGDGWKVTVGGRTDAVLGLSIIEGKTRFGHVSAQDYADTLQWRLYLAALPWARCVHYRVHEIGGMYSDKETGELCISKGGPYLKAIHTFSMWRQPGLEDEVLSWVGRFVDWAKAKGLTEHLKARESFAEAG